MLSQLQISHVRNLQQVRLQGLKKVNVFFGPNGSGKTSVLESIHLLGMARSFRGTSVKSLITHNTPSCTVYGVTSRKAAGEAGVYSAAGMPMGVQRSRSGEAQIKIGGKPVRTVAELAAQLPLQVITAESFSLLTGPPGGRRQYLDWGVFHVEQRFFGQWQRFQRCLKQRNNLLRRGKISDQELVVWTRDLTQTGEAINEYRKDYFAILSPRFKEIMARLAPSLDRLELRYQQGWDRELTYSEALQQGYSADTEQGYTHSGPQRADVRVMSGGHLAADTLSRGQQKLVVCGLKLAQGQLMAQLGNRGKCTYLIDDLPSELDHEHSLLVCELLESMDVQVFVTCIAQEEIRSVWPKTSEITMFHVEHGNVQRHPASDV
ncbi:DNA replication and repair protein RecF [Halioglobus japonicus]|nr:DNA replication and repair protein RecF [Halioglobus japonicus]